MHQWLFLCRHVVRVLDSQKIVGRNYDLHVQRVLWASGGYLKSTEIMLGGGAAQRMQHANVVYLHRSIGFMDEFLLNRGRQICGPLEQRKENTR